ncbi:hypothetical protein [Halodesulfovibrio sp. MK-HDV]|jgi:hypothetical protein|uniref:hypothetical protein n=1 Tax=Halodesulfovibrio sp. MK-HDV TaxID=2599925 RepID=UPI001371BDE1|nr:hypothetical protein [Halodesulfovibrio sp. MK-HDV]KAF1074531.1 hypothetical protein MKHDV_02606 [Halodesulfovibrio sp. MK-HDV]
MFIQLTAIAFIALGVIFSWFTTGHPKGNEAWQLPTFKIIYNLSYGYLASYIFYFINIYLPQCTRFTESTENVAYGIFKIMFGAKSRTIQLKTEQSDIPLERLINAFLEGLKKDYEQLLIWCEDRKVHEAIMQSYYLLLFARKFDKHSVEDWEYFERLINANYEILLDKLNKIDTPFSLRVLGIINGKVATEFKDKL